MTRHERHRFEMFVRVRNFGRAHGRHFPESSTAADAFAAIAAVVADMERQGTRKLLTADEGRRVLMTARQALVARLTAIVRTALVADRSAPGPRVMFRLPEHRSDLAWLGTARAFIDQGPAVRDWLVPLGMPETFVNDLQQLVKHFEQAMAIRIANRAEFKSALAAIAEANARGFEAIRRLDVIVANTQGDPALLAAWKRARRVERQRKPRRQVEAAPARAAESAVVATRALRQVS